MAGILVQALMANIDEERQLTSLSVSFTAPTDGDQPFDIHMEMIREGKNVSQTVAYCQQNGVIGTKITACFAKARQSAVVVTPSAKMTLRPPQSCLPVPLVKSSTPAFLQHISLLVNEGDMPFSGSQKPNLSGWMQYTQKPTHFNLAYLVGLIDAWPPTVLQMMPHPGPASTMTWHMSFPLQAFNFSGDDWFGYQAQTIAAEHGYSHSLAQVFSPSGQLLATSQQTIAIFD